MVSEIQSRKVMKGDVIRSDIDAFDIILHGLGRPAAVIKRFNNKPVHIAVAGVP